MKKMEIELSMVIDDSLRVIESFQPNDDYRGYFGCPEHFVIEIYIRHGNEVAGYLVCTIFCDDIIEDNGKDLVTVADDDTTQDNYEAMEVLRERRGQHSSGEYDPYLFLLRPSTVYIQNMAVKNDYRGRGIGNWLLRNLPQIITERYHRDLVTIVIKLFPEEIDWESTPPQFESFRSETVGADESLPYWSDEIDVYDESDPMFIKMKRLLENNGYSRYGNTLYFFKDFFWK